MTDTNLTEQEQQDLRRYGEVLRQYFDPEVAHYYPIGWKKIPKIRTRAAQQVQRERQDLEKKLGIMYARYIGIGEWELNMAGVSTQPGSIFSDSPYADILPIRSDNKQKLEYLAEQVFPQLPEIKPNQQFFVRTTYIQADW